MCSVTVILKRIFCVKEFLVHVLRGACCGTADVSIPCAHGPSCRIVGVKRDCIRIVLDCLQSCDKFIGSLGNCRYPCRFKYCLVVYDTLRVTRGSHAVYDVVIHPVICKPYYRIHFVQSTEGNEVFAKQVLVYRRNHHDIAPVACGKT